MSKQQVHNIKLCISASQIKSGKSGLYAVVYLKDEVDSQYSHIQGKTEVIKNTLNPSWLEKVYMDYHLGSPERVNIKIFNERKKKNKLDEEICSVFFEIGAILGSSGNVKARNISNGGCVFVHAVKVQTSQFGELYLHLLGFDLKKNGFFEPDAFFEISRLDRGVTGEFSTPVARSAHCLSNSNPRWKALTIDVNALCDGNKDNPIVIDVYGYRRSGKHYFLGNHKTNVNKLLAANHKTNVNKLLRASKRDTLDLCIEHKKKGSIFVFEAKINILDRPCFLDYLSGGMEIKALFAIDFTGSNGHPRDPKSLHYALGDSSLKGNDYQKAISAIGEIIVKYDSDKKFPVFGFGARYENIIRHCFQVGYESEVFGVGGILDAYRSMFQSPIILSNETSYHHCIAVASRKAKVAQDIRQCYSVLIILTAGDLKNDTKTKESLLFAKESPLSIIIIGIGNQNFEPILQLMTFCVENDLRVTFVPFHQHLYSKQSLTNKALENVPSEIVNYFYSRGRMPNSPEALENVDIVPDEQDEDEFESDIYNPFSYLQKGSRLMRKSILRYSCRDIE